MVHSRKQPGGEVVDAGGNSAGESPIISGRLIISDGPLGIQLSSLSIPHRHAAIFDNRNAGLFHFQNHLALSFRP